MNQDRGKKITLDKTIKNKTMNDLVINDIKKESHLRTTESGLITEKELPLIEIETSQSRLKNLRDRNIEQWTEYNKNVLQLDPKYSTSTDLVNGDILVRLFRKKLFDKYGFEKKHTAFMEGRNGAYKILPDKLAFNFIGVIANLDRALEPEDNESTTISHTGRRFKRGQVIQVRPDLAQTKMVKDNEGFQYLPNGYYRDQDEDENFADLGYILIKTSHIWSIINDFSIDEYCNIPELPQVKSNLIL